jgi:hypothetical protein
MFLCLKKYWNNVNFFLSIMFLHCHNVCKKAPTIPTSMNVASITCWIHFNWHTLWNFFNLFNIVTLVKRGFKMLLFEHFDSYPTHLHSSLCQNVIFMIKTIYNYVLNLVMWIKVSIWLIMIMITTYIQYD